MLNIGPPELLVVLVIALIVVGPQKLPELARTVGRALNEFRKVQDEVKDMVKLDLSMDPVTTPPTTDTTPPPTPHRTPRPAATSAEGTDVAVGREDSDAPSASAPADAGAVDPAPDAAPTTPAGAPESAE
jgi:sec-independent protein translocase protein TatB